MTRQGSNDRIDPAYSYIDEKIEPIMEKLTSLDNLLLRTQRVLATLSIAYDVHNTVSIIANQKPRKVNRLKEQIAVDAGKSTTEVETSTIPLIIADHFKGRCNKIMHDEHCKTTMF